MNYVCIKSLHLLDFIKPHIEYVFAIGKEYKSDRSEKIYGANTYIYLSDEFDRYTWVNKNNFKTKEELRDQKLSLIGI